MTTIRGCYLPATFLTVLVWHHLSVGMARQQLLPVFSLITSLPSSPSLLSFYLLPPCSSPAFSLFLPFFLLILTTYLPSLSLSMTLPLVTPLPILGLSLCFFFFCCFFFFFLISFKCSPSPAHLPTAAPNECPPFSEPHLISSSLPVSGSLLRCASLLPPQGFVLP